MPSIINQKEFDKRVKYNTKLFVKQQKANEFTPSMYYLWDADPKALSTLQYCGMDHDIYAAAVTGTLVISDKRKHDSILMKNNKVIEVELKTSYLNTKEVFKTIGEKIYIYDRTGITNYLKAAFGGNPPEDDMLVYLVCCDTTDKWNTEIIDVWQMKGEVAINLLGKAKQITLKKFIDHGKKKHVEVNVIGWKTYVNTMLKRLPIKKTLKIV